MTNTYIALSTITLATATSSVTFGSIPQTYRDLVLVIFARSASTDSNLRLRFNGDSGSNYTYVRMFGNGSSAFSDSTGSSGLQVARLTQNNAAEYGTGMNHIMDYSATDKHKTVLSRTGVASAFTFANAGRWANTAAITSLTFTGYDSGFDIGSGTTFSLYGIAG